MVDAFQFARLPLIHFGTGKISVLPGLLSGIGNEILLVTGRSSFINSLNSINLFNALRENGITCKHLIISGEPSTEIIDQAVRTNHEYHLNAVVAIGGGSVIDAGKAISAMMLTNDSVSGYLESVGTKNHDGTKLPFIAVPTTSGTGSEVTKNAVISRVGVDGFKRSLRHENFVPEIAIVDPGLTVSCPPEITASSGMDCFTQLLESYLSVKSNRYTDALAYEGLKEIKASLVESYINGENIESRTGMSFSALTSGICLANAGLGAVHGFASSIGGRYNIPHGLICGTLMAKSNEVNIRELRKKGANPEALRKYAILGELFSEVKGRTDDFYTDHFIDYLNNLTYNLKLSRLGKYGVEEKDLELICSKTEIKNNPVKLAVENLYEIIFDRL